MNIPNKIIEVIEALPVALKPELFFAVISYMQSESIPPAGQISAEGQIEFAKILKVLNPILRRRRQQAEYRRRKKLERQQEQQQTQPNQQEDQPIQEEQAQPLEQAVEPTLEQSVIPERPEKKNNEDDDDGDGIPRHPLYGTPIFTKPHSYYEKYGYPKVRY